MPVQMVPRGKDIIQLLKIINNYIFFNVFLLIPLTILSNPLNRSRFEIILEFQVLNLLGSYFDSL